MLCCLTSGKQTHYMYVTQSISNSIHSQCVGILAEALGQRWLPFAKQLLEPIVLTGLSDTLVQSLRKVTNSQQLLLPHYPHDVCVGM